MIRVPAVLAGVLCASSLSTIVFVLAGWLGDRQILVIALPIIAGIGGFIAGRGPGRPAPVPGLAVAIMLLAIRIGLGLGMYESLLSFIDPGVALLELIAAITGGLLGTMTARHAADQPIPEHDFQTLS